MWTAPQVMRAGSSQRPLTPGQGQQSQQESLAAAANPALAYAGMSGQQNRPFTSNLPLQMYFSVGYTIEDHSYVV